jgi:drug/metabolite transporter (DMT)-like permease
MIAARLAPLLFVLLWSGGFTAVKLALPHAEPLTLQVLRYALVLAALAPVALLRRPAWPRGAALRHLLWMGLILQFGYFAATNLAQAHGISPAGLALAIALQPILVALLAHRVTGDPAPGPRVWLGLCCGLAGCALAILSGGAVTARGWPGPLFAVLALATLTAGALLERRGGQAGDPVAANLILYAVGLAATFPVAWASETMRVDWAPELWAGLAYLVLANSLLAISLLFWMLRRGEAARVSSLFFLVPPMAALIAWVVLGVAVPPLGWAGLALAALGVALVARR